MPHAVRNRKLPNRSQWTRVDDFHRLNVWANNHSTYQGMFDVYAYNEKYCTGEHRQYARVLRAASLT